MKNGIHSPYLSIIIPVRNEEENLNTLIPYLLDNGHKKQEIIIIDCEDSVDNSNAIAERYQVTYVQCVSTSRATQLVRGAEEAKGEILYFLHADTQPPKTFAQDIQEALNTGIQAGCFSYKFRPETHAFMKLNSFVTKFQTIFTGGGDQGLFIDRKIYSSVGGYDGTVEFMEDFTFYRKLKETGIPFKIIPHLAIVSSRKYERNSYLKVNFINGIVLTLFFLGVSHRRLKTIYQRLN